MAVTTAIEWTDHTFNPWLGCTKVSPGCDHCYAEFREDHRFHRVKWGHGNLRRATSVDTWQQPRKWNGEATAEGRPHQMFCASEADVFDAEVDDSWREWVWEYVRWTPMLHWQVLTKRPNLIRKKLPHDLHNAPNLWLGTTVENADYLYRIEELIETPAVVHFLSVEPMLGPIPKLPLRDVEWVICGGESGPQRRQLDNVDWVRDIRDQCLAANVPFFFKQWGGLRPKDRGKTLDGREWCEFPQ